MSNIKTNGIIALAICISANVVAQELPSDDEDNNFFIRAGVFYAKIDSNFDSDGKRLDYEEHLKLSENTFSPTLEMIYHFNERHLTTFNFYSLRRKANQDYLSKSFTGPFDNDVLYQVGMHTESLLNTDIYQVNYGYNFIYKENWALGVSLGLHIIDFETYINATGTIDSTDNAQDVNGKSINNRALTVPLPNFGLSAYYAFSNKWKLSTHAQYLHIVTDHLDGGMIDARIALKYQISKNFSVIGAVNYDLITFKEIYGKSDYALTYRYIGPLLLVEYGF